MKNKIFAAVLLLFGLLFALIAHNALFVVHYDLDPVSVLASLLNLRIPTLGYLSIGVSLLLLFGGVRLVQRG